MRLFFCIFGLTICFHAMSITPSQVSPKKILLQYELFNPFGNTEVELAIGDNGYIEKLSIVTELREITIPADSFITVRFPILAGIEVMHIGNEGDGFDLEPSFSLCIPYGSLEVVENQNYRQRPVLVVYVTPSGERIENIPPPKNGVHYQDSNGCFSAGMEPDLY